MLRSLVILLICAFSLTAAQMKYVVDLDGQPNSILGLAALLRSVASPKDVLLVTVSGNTWSSLSAGVLNVKAFLAAAGWSIPVAAGSQDYFVDSGELTKSCIAPVMDAPRTPFAMLEQQQKYNSAWDSPHQSIFDVDNLFGEAESLAKLVYSYEQLSSDILPDAVAALKSALRSARPSRVNYLAFASLTNLAIFLKSSDSIDKLKLNVHIDVGATRTATADPAAAEFVFSYQSLYRRLYTSKMSNAVTFDDNSWNRLLQVPSIIRSDRSDLGAMKWLTGTYAAMKASVVEKGNTPKAIFYQIFRPSASLVSLFVSDIVLQSLVPRAISKSVDVNATSGSLLYDTSLYGHDAVHFGTDVLEIPSDQWAHVFWQRLYTVLEMDTV